MKGSVFLCLSAAFVFTLLPTTSTAAKVEVQTKEGYIVDMAASTKKGAKLLGGMTAQDKHACVQECAGEKTCDLAVFKIQGHSESGRNCYLLACTERGNCVTAEHDGFVSSFLHRSTQSEEKEDEKVEDSDDVLKALEAVVDHVFTDKDTKETADNVAESEGKETVGNAPTDKSELPFNPHQSGPKESHVATEGSKAMVDEKDNNTKEEETENDNANSDSVSEEEDEEASVQEVLDSLEDEFSKMADDNTVNIQSVPDETETNSNALNTAPSPNPAGVIVGVVLGGCVMVLVVSTVMAIGMRKGWEAFKKRKYKKMDYLINGMYS